MFTATKGILKEYGYEVVTLAGAGHEVKILPVNGFNLFAWTFEGQELLMKPADLTAFGSKYGMPILYPTPNRIKDATYTWQGKTHVMTKRGQKILRHGLVMDEPFTVRRLEAGEDSALCEAEIALREGDALTEGYPFPSTLTVRYTLTARGVHMDLTVRNDGSEALPFGVAVHPYFSKRGDANRVFIKVPCRRIYETDDALIPTGRIVPAGEDKAIADDFRSVESLYLDTVYRGMTQDLESQVQYEDVVLHIRASDCFRNAVVFTPHDRPGFCIEPQTNATNCINLHAQGLIDESGLMVLPAGQTFACFVDYSVTKR